MTSLIATPPQQLKVFYSGARSGDNGAPLVKARLLKDHFPDTRFRFSLVYLLSNAIYLPDLAIESIRRRGIPIVLNQNGVFYPAWYRGDWQRENARMATAYHQASHVFWQSQFCRRCANRFLGERSGSGEVLLNATDIDHFVPRSERNSQDSYVLLVTGKIGHSTAYRLESSIAGVAEARRGGLDVMLRIAGIVDPAVEAEMRAKAETLGILDAVNFFGPYTRLEAPAIYQSADAYLMTKHNDPCPNAVIEAMASGLPVLYSASGGVPELARPIHEGWPWEVAGREAWGVAAGFSPLVDIELRKALAVEGRGLIGAPWPRRLWSGGLQRDGNDAEEIGFRAGGGEGQADARGGLDDAGAELEQAQAQGRELGRSQDVGFGDGVADGEHQPVGGGVEHKANLVGDR